MRTLMLAGAFAVLAVGAAQAADLAAPKLVPPPPPPPPFVDPITAIFTGLTSIFTPPPPPPPVLPPPVVKKY